MKRPLANYRMIFALLLLFMGSLCMGQTRTIDQDRLDQMDDERLLSLFERFYGDTLQQEKIARTYLDRARREGDTIKMARGYDRLASIFSMNQALAYTDSIIRLTEHLNHKTYPGLAYLLKGGIYYNNDMPHESMVNFIKARDYADKSGNVYHEMFIRRNLIRIALIWGEPTDGFNQAKAFDKYLDSIPYKEMFIASTRDTYENKDEWKKDYVKEKLNAINLIVVASIYDEEYDTAIVYAKKGAEMAKTADIEEYNRFLNRIGEIEYYRGNFESAIRYLEESKSYNRKPRQYLNHFFYLGKSYLGMGEKAKGFRLLLLADSIYNETSVIYPSHTPMFYDLYAYYIENNDSNKQIEYLQKIIDADSVFKLNYRNIYSKIIKGYQTPILLNKKEALIKKLENQNKRKKVYTYVLICALIIFSLVGAFYARRQQLYKKRFEALRNLQNDSNNENTKRSFEISEEVVSEIISKLEQFAREEQFVRPDITLQSLADMLGTNANYLSRIINFKLGKNFTRYLNDLRIAYALRKLNEDTRFRKYTVKAIAESCGYRSADSFSRAFYKRHGIYPSYYVRKLNEQKSS